MQSQLFRKTSVERISSAEQLQDYMRVTSPGIWMVLVAVAVLLAGLIASSALATLESGISVQAVAEEDGTTLQIALPLAQRDRVAPGMAVRVADREARVTLEYAVSDGVMLTVALEDGGEPLAPGTYDAWIVTEVLRPIRFLIGGEEADD